MVRTDAHVATLAASQRVFAAAGARVHRDRLLDDETIFHQLPDCLTWNTNVENTHMKRDLLNKPLQSRITVTPNVRELALAISLVSLGSSQTFFLPQRRTLDAKRFWSLSMLKHTGEGETAC